MKKKSSNLPNNSNLNFITNKTFIIIIIASVIIYFIISFISKEIINLEICDLKKEKGDIKIYECNFNNGNKYEGEIKNRKFDGEGIFIWANGDVFIGNWKNGERKDGYFHKSTDGKIMKNIETMIEDGNFYEGEFKNGKFDGKGLYKYKNGDIYRGEFKEGYRDGKGIYLWNDNKFKYDGEWKNDLKHGIGTFTEYGYLWNSEKHGIWQNDKLIKETKK